jgi:hypothetical protein
MLQLNDLAMLNSKQRATTPVCGDRSRKMRVGCKLQCLSQCLSGCAPPQTGHGFLSEIAEHIGAHRKWGGHLMGQPRLWVEGIRVDGNLDVINEFLYL